MTGAEMVFVCYFFYATSKTTLCGTEPVERHDAESWLRNREKEPGVYVYLKSAG